MKAMKKIDVPINNFWYKLAALALALLLWFYVMQTQNNVSDLSLTVPLEYRNLPASLVVTNDPVQVRVRVQGSGNGTAISAKDVQAYVDLGATSAGKTEVTVQVVVPNSFDIVSVSPGQVSLEIEPEESKQLPVEVNMEFATPLPQGKRVLDPVLTPAEVLIFGAESRLNNISRVVVTANITNPTENYLGAVPVQIFDKNDKVINDYFRLNPSVVDVSIPIVDEVPTKRVTITVPTTGTVAEGYHIDRIVTNPEIITVSGEYADLEKISTIYTEPVDVAGAMGNIALRQKLTLPEGITVNGVSEVSVTVEISRREQMERQSFSGLTIKPLYVGEGLVAKVVPDKIDVTVQGTRERISSLKPEDIMVQADLTGLAAGNLQVDIKVVLPEGVQLVEQSETTAAVELVAVEE
ncbi:MAG: hypothetical protein HFI72_04510 [Peptococcaceae bacterium]|nr:hypothetical protein [Peptococcaceae bacterium]